MNERLVRAVARLAPQDGTVKLGPGVSVVRNSGTQAQAHYGVQVASVCIVAQGSKRLFLSGEVVEYDETHLMVGSVDVPVASRVIDATPERPFLCVKLALDPSRVASLASRMFPEGLPEDRVACPLALVEAGPGLLDAAARLVEAYAEEGTAALFAPLAFDEIVLHLLRSPVGPRVARASAAEAGVYNVAQAVGWLRSHFAESVSVEALADVAHMSVSSFHQHFKSVTSLTPIQYLKTVRLQHARSLMLDRKTNANEAASQVGYASPSQFSRDYSRYFGTSPARDASALRDKILRLNAEV